MGTIAVGNGRIIKIGQMPLLCLILALRRYEEGRRVARSIDELPDMRLKSSADGTVTKLKNRNVFETHETLGNWLCPLLPMVEAYEFLMEKATLCSSRLITSSLSKRDTWIACFTVFIPMISCTFPVTHCTQKELKKLQSPVHQATLLKLGFDRNTAHAVMFGSVQYGGLGMRNLWVEQGVAHLLLIIRHLRDLQTISGCHLR